MPAETWVLLVTQLGAVLGAGLSAREADLEALALLGRLLQDDPETTLAGLVEDLRGAGHVTVSGPHAGALLGANGIRAWRQVG